jgi:hypothetical protein
MRQQNRQQRKREGPATAQRRRMLPDPVQREKIALADQRRQTQAEILHEQRPGACGREDAHDQQTQRYPSDGDGCPGRKLRVVYRKFGQARGYESSRCSSLPGLKRTALPGVMVTSAPVRGLRPIPVLRGRTLKTPNPRNSMRSPDARAFLRLSKTVSTAASALLRGSPVFAIT